MPARDLSGRPLLALTGASGFVGSHLVEHFTARGWRVRALVRRWPPPSGIAAAAPVEIITGALSEEAALARLFEGADAIIHAAGMIKARAAEALLHTNRDLARTVAAAAARHAPAAPFLLLSSLAAREPQLSAYAASKQAGETAVAEALGGRGPIILRPPAVYGPGDRETLRLFAMAARGRILTPAAPATRLGLIAVADLCGAAEAVLRTPQAGGRVFACDDGCREGYGWDDLARLAGAAVGHHVGRVRIPAWAVLAAGIAGSALHRVGLGDPQLSIGKAREILHADWRGDNRELTGLTGFAPAIGAREGFAAAVAWYRRNNWL
jgi:nucleoside-diphosphate-sugar epimerase